MQLLWSSTRHGNTSSCWGELEPLEPHWSQAGADLGLVYLVTEGVQAADHLRGRTLAAAAEAERALHARHERRAPVRHLAAPRRQLVLLRGHGAPPRARRQVEAEEEAELGGGKHDGARAEDPHQLRTLARDPAAPPR